MLNKTIFIYLLTVVTALQLFAQSDSTRTWHLYWDYTQTSIDSGKVNNFVITRLNSETSDQVQRTRQIGDLEVVEIRNDTITYRDPDNDIIPNVIYAYTVQAASSDTAFSDPGNVAQAVIPKILAPAVREFIIDNDTGLSNGSVPFQILNPLEEDIDISYTKSVTATSGGDIDINLGSNQFSFSSSLDSGEVAYVDLTALNTDITKSFFYTWRVTLLFTSKSNVLESDPEVLVTPKSAQITWRTTEVTRDYIRYGTTPAKEDSTSQDQNYIINHSRTLSNLTPNTTYFYNIVSQTQNNGHYISREYTFKTDTLVESVLVDDPDVSAMANTAQITWQTTEPTTDYIAYGTTTTKSERTIEELTFSTDHSETLTNLVPNTTYYYSIFSRTEAPNSELFESDEYTFSTIEMQERATRAYPGKFRAKEHDYITFYDIPPSGTLSIYSWSGDLVFEKSGLAPGNLQWYVQNPDGRNISSGFYLYKIKDQNGNIDGEGTLIIIR